MEKNSFKLSPSSMKIMLECPRCFWLTSHKVWKRPESPFPSLPSGMDRILKIHFDKFMEKGQLPPEIKDNIEFNGCKLFDDKSQLDIWRNNFKGVQYKDKTSGILLRGAIDNLLSKGKKFILIDYKTRGYPVKEDTADLYQMQMDVYNFLLRENGYETEDYTYLLFYYPKEVNDKGEIIFNTEVIKLKTSVKNGKKYFEDAIKLLEGDCPSKRAVSGAMGDEKGEI